MEHRNTREGYDPENVTPIPDEEDPGVGFSAGSNVEIVEDHHTYPGERGEVYAVARDDFGQIVVDVLIDGTSEAERFSVDEIGDTL